MRESLNFNGSKGDYLLKTNKENLKKTQSHPDHLLRVYWTEQGLSPREQEGLSARLQDVS